MTYGDRDWLPTATQWRQPRAEAARPSRQCLHLRRIETPFRVMGKNFRAGPSAVEAPAGMAGQVLRSAIGQREFELSGVTVEAGGLQHTRATRRTRGDEDVRSPLPAQVTSCRSSNHTKAVEWGVSTSKVGDPILINLADQRGSGRAHLQQREGRIRHRGLPRSTRFDVELDQTRARLSTSNTWISGWVRNSIVRFAVYGCPRSDEDDDALDTTVPFQGAYTVSSNKTRGLQGMTGVKARPVTHDHGGRRLAQHLLHGHRQDQRPAQGLLDGFRQPAEVLGSLEHQYNHEDVSLLSSRRGQVSRWASGTPSARAPSPPARTTTRP